MLKAGGYVESGGPGLWRITSRGRDLLALHPDRFDDETARQIVRESRKGHQAAMVPEESWTDSVASSGQQTPEERIEAALTEIQRSVARELLEKILQAPPIFFEQMVLDLLHALGYGTSADDLEHVGAAGDGGIDGVISLDRLGFEKVYVQAKRWQGSVGRPEVQAFFGALAGRRARKGVLITTSSFTREAREYSGQIAESVVLIDGVRLTALMIEHGVGVTHYRVVRLPRVDGDYFDGA